VTSTAFVTGSLVHVKKGNIMLYTIAIILLALWILGMVTATTAGGLLHILLVIAVVMVVINLISGRRAL
jgi:uncharacterized membrane protein YtjA (UPF0391 family)